MVLQGGQISTQTWTTPSLLYIAPPFSFLLSIVKHQNQGLNKILFDVIMFGFFGSAYEGQFILFFYKLNWKRNAYMISIDYCHYEIPTISMRRTLFVHLKKQCIFNLRSLVDLLPRALLNHLLQRSSKDDIHQDLLIEKKFNIRKRIIFIH